MCEGSMLGRRNPAARVLTLRGAMMRKAIDCRDMPNDVGCTLTISGEEDEVLRAATQHAITVHGHQESPELNQALRSMLKSEVPA